jgi:hypothetical protein
MTDISAFFDRFGWAYTMPEANLWQSAFFTENEEEFDLYVMVVDDWVHFAVTPFLPPIPSEQAARIHRAVLKLNQQMKLVRFALDDDGDLSLIADSPAAQLTDAFFVQIMEAFVNYADQLASELRRLTFDAAYVSPLLRN